MIFLKEKTRLEAKGKGLHRQTATKRRARVHKGRVRPPAVELDSVPITVTIDVKERQDVDVSEIPGAYLRTELDKGD